MNKKTVKIAIIFLLPLLVTIGIAVWFGVVRQLSSYQQTTKNLTKAKVEVASSSDRVTALKKANNNRDENQKIFDSVNNLWPDKEDVSKFIVQLESLANENKVTIPSVTIANNTTTTKAAKTTDDSGDSPTTKTNKTQDTGTRFTFNGKAPYPTVTDLIVGLEQLARFNKINTISLSADKNGSISFTISGMIYAK